MHSSESGYTNTNSSVLMAGEGFRRDLERSLKKTKHGMKEADRQQFEECLQNMQQSVEDVLCDLSGKDGWKWHSTSYSDVEAIKRQSTSETPVIIRAMPVSIEDVRSEDGVDMASAVLRDVVSGDLIETTSITDPLLRQMQELRRTNGVLDFLGFSVMNPLVDRPNYVYLIADIRVPEQPLHLVMATPSETSEAETKLANMKSQRIDPIDWLIQEVADINSIRGLESNPAYVDMLRGVVLQALSDGHVGHANGRIHDLFVGPPASGKKLLVRSAGQLNLTFRHASQKLTAAGLVGTAHSSKGTYTSEPGLLPQASRGTLALEDFHAVPNARRADIMGHLAQVMEDGEVHDSTSARRTMRALTGIHFDLNRMSDLHPNQVIKDDQSHLPSNIISRFDLIFDVPKDSDRQFDVAKAIIKEMGLIGPQQGKKEQHRIRAMKMVVATLRTQIPDVSISDSSRQKAEDLVENMKESYKRQERFYSFLSMFIVRMTNSLLKIAAANARGHQRAELVDEDIDVAKKFLEHKLAYLARIAEAEADAEVNLTESDRRFAEARAVLGAAPFTAKEYSDVTGTSRPTAYRDLERLAATNVLIKIAHGRYRFADKAGEAA